MVAGEMPVSPPKHYGASLEQGDEPLTPKIHRVQMHRRVPCALWLPGLYTPYVFYYSILNIAST